MHAVLYGHKHVTGLHSCQQCSGGDENMSEPYMASLHAKITLGGLSFLCQVSEVFHGDLH